MKRLFFALCFCGVCSYAHTQNNKILRIGDTLPAITVTVLSGDNVSKVPLASFYKDKPVILDFWATWCGSCVRTMAEADLLIKKSGNAFGLVPISYEDRKTVGAFVKKNKVMQKLPFSYVAEDTVLMGRMINFRELPHEVWVGKDGVIKAITYAEELTTENTEAFVKNEVLYLPEKNDKIDYDYSKPFEVSTKDILYRSILTGYRPGLYSTINDFTSELDHSVQVNRLFASNVSMIHLLYTAFSQNRGLLDHSRIEMVVNDSIALDPFKFLKSPTRKQKLAHLYCYELLLPEKMSEEHFFSKMLEELNQVLPYEGHVEKRKKLCWVLINCDPKKNPTTKGEASKIKWELGYIKRMTNQHMNLLTEYLNWNMKRPVFDESGFTNAFDMEFKFEGKFQNERVELITEKVQESLKRYGFELVQEERLTEVLVIREKSR